MNADLLLDAIGMADDRFFLEDAPVRRLSLRRTFAAALVAALILVLSIGTALAVSPQLREYLFSVFEIETPEAPPSGSANELPTEYTNSGLKELEIVNIEENVTAHYFTTDSYIKAVDGGFYTSSHRDSDEDAPEDAVFWEITREGIRQVEHSRIEFPLPVSDRTLEIIFDYAIINGKLCIATWPKYLNKDPLGNSWNITPIGDRTDVVFLEVPYLTANTLSRKFYLLNLASLEMTDLAPSLPVKNTIVHSAGFLSNSTKYLLIYGWDSSANTTCYWLYNRENDSTKNLSDLTDIDANFSYFLNDETILLQEYLGEYPNNTHLNVISYHIPSGIKHTIVESTHRDDYMAIPAEHGTSTYGKLTRPDGSVAIINHLTKEVLELTGMRSDRLVLQESPSKTHILVAYQEGTNDLEPGYNFSQLGLLDIETGTLKMLTRNLADNIETFRGWLDDHTVVISSHAPDHNYQEKDNYYLYVYTFE